MSKWTDFVKDFARRNNMTYGCALSNPDCSKEYRDKNPKLTKKEQKEGENMGAEEQTGVVNKELHKKAEHKKRVVTLKAKVNKKQVDKELLEKYPAFAENKQMGAEDKDALPAPPSRVPTSAKATEPAKKKAGRPKKYATEAEAKEAKKVKTIESNKRRAEAKKVSKTPKPEDAKALRALKAKELPRITAVQQLAEAQGKGLTTGGMFSQKNVNMTKTLKAVAEAKEQKDAEENEKKAKRAKDMGNNPNSIYPDPYETYIQPKGASKKVAHSPSAKGLDAGYSGEADNGLTHIYPLTHDRLLKMLKHLV